MRAVHIALLALAASSCGAQGEEEKVEIDQTFDAQMASQAIAQALPKVNGVKIYAVCGPSAGKGLYEVDEFEVFQSDGISEGRFVFFSAQDGTGPDVVFRDAGGQHIFARDGGADVMIIGPEKTMWIVSYPSTGVVETHNFVVKDNQLIDLWTSNKPDLFGFGPSARLFTATCFRP